MPCAVGEDRRRAEAGPVRPELTTHDFLDITLRLFHAGHKIVFQPRSVIQFHSPPGVDPEERPFFRQRWDRDYGFFSTNRVRERHGLAQIPSAKTFSGDRLHRESWLHLGLYTLRVRVLRRLRTQFRKRVLRRHQWDLLDYVSGPVPEKQVSAPGGSATTA